MIGRCDMRIRYKYIHFAMLEKKQKTSVWSCRNNASDYELGRVEWYYPWRQYCFFPSGDSLFNKGCMLDIIDFMENLRAKEGGVM